MPPYFPQSDTSVWQHVAPGPANDSGEQLEARPSYRTLTSGSGAVGIEESFRLVNVYCYMTHFFLLINKLKGQDVLLGKLSPLASGTGRPILIIPNPTYID